MMIGQRIGNIKYEFNKNLNEFSSIISERIDRFNISDLKYDFYRNVEKGYRNIEKGVERVDLEFNRRLHIILLAVFLAMSTFFVVHSYITFGLPVMLYSIIVLTIALVGENLISRAGVYSYNMDHKPMIGRVPLYIPLLWLTMNLGSLFISYFAFASLGIHDGFQIALFSAMIPLLVDLLFLEPKLSRDRQVWTWENTTKLYAPYGNYLVWFAFPFLTNLLFIIFAL
jgi:uncharacterized membrane protein